MIAGIAKLAAAMGLVASVSAAPLEARQATPVQAPYPWKWDMMIPPNVTDLATLAPKVDHSAISTRSFSCSSLASGLTASDCAYMSQIGMAGQGDNVVSNNNYIWIGNQGPNVFTFNNQANPPVGIILVLWDAPAGDYDASIMSSRRPKISYSIPYGGSVTVSIANGVSGAWSALYDHKTILSQYGQIWNTWGEFTTGAYATVDISREIHMAGNNFNAQVSTGCLADLTHCAYVCKSGDTCGTPGSYDLIGCTGVNTGVGSYNGNPSGGCYGWSNGAGKIVSTFY